MFSDLWGKFIPSVKTVDDRIVASVVLLVLQRETNVRVTEVCDT